MSIVWQFLVFVDDFLLGSMKEDTNKEVFNSRNVMESVQESITNIINKHTQSVDQNAYVEKNINIDCGSSNLTPFQLLLRNKEYDFWRGGNLFGFFNRAWKGVATEYAFSKSCKEVNTSFAN